MSERFKYGDLIIRCCQCGDKQVVESMVQDGRAIYLFNTADSSLRLSCDKCKVAMEMLIVPNEDIEDELNTVESDEGVQARDTVQEVI